MMKYLPLLLLIPISALHAETRTWISPEKALADDPDFAIQGEYGGKDAGHGVQVVAMGGGKFNAWLYDGGLPGDGWSRGDGRLKLEGSRSEGQAIFTHEDGKTRGEIKDGVFHLTLADGGKHTLQRIERTSPTLGAPAPEGAVVLFDGTNTDAWENGVLMDDALVSGNNMSKRHFRDFTAHFEFMTPYRPHERGQRRGNSGIYFGGRWEVQILDTFGLGGEQDHCGGIYLVAKPQLNMCLPPLVWQTYDVKFTAPRFDAAGNRIAWPRVTVHHNGVLIHDEVELNRDFTTAAPINAPLTSEEGPIFLQSHGSQQGTPVLFRNIWVVPVD
jgi:hypothetical protein